MIVFLVAGFGYGNASRQLAIIQELRKKDQDLSITVFSWGRGYDFLQPEAKALRFELRSLFSLTSTRQNSFLISFIMTGLFYLIQYPVNFLYLLGWGFIRQPKIVIFDSDYHVPAFLFSRAKRISVNQVPNIHWAGKKYSLSFIRRQGFLFSYLVESMDYLFQSLFANEILVPVLNPKKSFGRHSWIRLVPLIVRPQFLKTSTQTIDSDRGPALVLGGSGVDTEKLRNWAQKKSIRIFERTPGESSERSCLLNEIRSHNPLIVQGGLSSLSEGLALQKYLFVSPVARHWEQFINCEEVIALGHGQRVTSEELAQEFTPAMKKFTVENPVDCSGAQVIGEYLYEKMQKAREPAVADSRAFQ